MGIIQVFRGIKGILYSTAIHVSREFREIYKTKKKAKKKKPRNTYGIWGVSDIIFIGPKRILIDVCKLGVASNNRMKLIRIRWR